MVLADQFAVGPLDFAVACLFGQAQRGISLADGRNRVASCALPLTPVTLVALLPCLTLRSGPSAGVEHGGEQLTGNSEFACNLQ